MSIVLDGKGVDVKELFLTECHPKVSSHFSFSWVKFLGFAQNLFSEEALCDHRSNV